MLTADDRKRLQEAVQTLIEFKERIGSHEFASLAGVSYPVNAEQASGMLLSTKEAAAKWGLTAWTVRRWVHKGLLRPVRDCKGWKFKQEDIEGAIRRL